ncbi:MAG: hypothetical protein RQ760_21035 [Sedimentisphaerales bacterium]|nr:hypothetical protein [Sedimentisphaerales bacterium]
MLTKSTMKRHIILLNLVLVCVAILSTEARADLYDSWAVVENNSGMPGIVASQLSVEVTDPGISGQVLFTFKNTGSYSFYISDIYFDDGTLLGIASIDNSDPGVSFGFSSPSNFPGGNTVYPPFVTSFSADNDPGAVNGIGPGESVGLYFNLAGGNAFADTINALNVGFDPSAYYTGSGIYDGWTQANLRIGVHVQGIDGPWGEGQSDTYLLTPVPPSLIIGILGMGVGVLGLKLRKYA